MPSKPHTLEEFDLELQSLRGSVLSMGGTAQEMVDQIGNLLCSRAMTDAEEAEAREKELDQSETQVDDQARRILLKYQPVATDLREVTGAVRMATDLEQIGDDAKLLLVGGKRLQAWIAGDAESVLEELWLMGRRALADAFAAFVEHRPEQAKDVTKFKRKIRKCARRAREHVAASVSRDQRLAPAFVEAVNATHLLERIGLQACSLAEAVYFIETATHSRHGPKEN